MQPDTTLTNPVPKTHPAYNLAVIDYTRIVMALFVIGAHCSALRCFGEDIHYYAYEWFARLAVPFFFFCTGFFLSGNASGSEMLRRNISVRIKKLLQMYLFWTVLYIPLILCEYIFGGKADSFRQGCLTFIHEFFISGSYFHLWYLNASAFSLFLLWCFVRRQIPWRRILLAAAILYCAGLSFGSWYRLVRLLPFWDIPVIYHPTRLFLTFVIRPSSGLFFGFPMTALGVYVSQHPIPPRKTCHLGFALSMAAGFAEITYIRFLGLGGPFPDSSLYIFLPFAVAFLFCSLLQIPVSKQTDTRKLRRISSLIYLVHKWFIELLAVPRLLFGLGILPFENSLSKFIIVTAASVVFALIVIRLSEKQQFAWVKKFY